MKPTSGLFQEFSTPWKIFSELRRYLAWPLARLHFALHGVGWKRGWKIYGLPIIQRHTSSTIEIGEGAILRSFTASNPLAPNRPVLLTTRSKGAEILIGQNFGMTGGTLCAEERIEIGDRVLIGANSIVVDTDFHPLDVNQRQRTPTLSEPAPVHIGDDVFVGMQSLILKGVRIGKGSVIGAGSVVTKDVPPGVVAAGNPARVLKKLA
jgi:acetyltransferase-like isoleucine patch superfamily enzyme